MKLFMKKTISILICMMLFLTACDSDIGGDIPVTGVELNKSSITISVGETEQLTATIAPADATNLNVSWASSNSSVVEAGAGGLVTAKEGGAATITITITTEDGSFTDTCEVTVNWNVGDKVPLTADDVSFTMVYMPDKSFLTNTNDDDEATVRNPYLIGETEVTYELWNIVYDWGAANGYTFANPGREGSDGTIGADPSSAAREPVTTVHWRDCMVWCNAATEWYNSKKGTGYTCAYYTDPSYTVPLRTSTNADFAGTPDAGSEDLPYIMAVTNGNTDMANCTATGFRLLTGNEWELAARYIADSNNDGDITDRGEYYPGNYASGADAGYSDISGASDYDGDNDIEYSGDVAWYYDNSDSSSHAVKGKSPNTLGLYDMSGNVLEWCFDWDYGDYGRIRMTRGGGWIDVDRYNLQIGYDGIYNSPAGPEESIGFRVARGIEQP